MSSSIQQLCGTARPRRGSATSVGSFDMSTSASKRSRGGSISGRLRTASDLEDLGWIDKSQKGHIKDLIISGDPVLRSALDKYEAGDKGELEVLIKQGALTGRRHSLAGLDLLDGLDLDFLNVKYHTDHGGVGGGGGNGGGGGGGGGDGHYDAAHDAAFSAATFDDFFGPFPETDMALGGDGIDSSGKHGGGGGGGGGARVSYPRANSLLGTFDFTDRTSERLSERADGGGGGGGGGGSFSSLFSTSSHYTRRNSLTSGLLGPGGAEEVPLSAYESLAASLQQQKPTGRRPGRAAAPAKASHHAPQTPRGVRGTARAAKATYAEEDEEEEEDDDDEDYTDRPATQHRGGRGRRAAGQSQQTQYPQPRKTGLRGLAKNSSSCQGVPEPTRLAAATLSSGIYNPALGGERPAGWLGYYSPQERRERIARFLAKRDRRVWTKKVKYDVRKNFADSRVRVKGRFVKKEDEEAMRELVSF